MLRRRFDTLLHSIRGRLILLTTAVVVPACLIAGLLINDAYLNQRTAIERQLSETARALSLVVDRQLGQSRSLLRGLATSPDLARGDIAAFMDQARSAVADSERWIVLVDHDGRQLANTRGPHGQPAPNLATANDQPPLPQDQARISNLHPCDLRDGSILAVTIPVTVAGTEYSLALVMPSSALNDVLADQQLPDGWVAAILDGELTVAAHNGFPERFVGDGASTDLQSLLRQRDHALLEHVDLDSVSTMLALSRAPGSGWTVAVGAPHAQLAATVRRLLLIAFFGTFGLLLVGVAMSVWIGRRVVLAMDGLSASARMLGRGETPTVATGMRETDRVAEAMQKSALRLKAREDELRRLNETLEARIAEAAENLVQARKLEALGRLTGGVAHDFNNLLTAVRVNLDLLRRRIDDEKLLKIIDSAYHATDRGVTLTSQLLAFGRRQRLQPEPVDVNAAVSTMTELLRSTLGGDVHVETVLAPKLPPAHADRTQLELIIMNLALNARDAMPGGGKIRIETSEVELTEPPTRPEHADPGRYVQVTVVDNGSGMSPEVLAHVFEPFFTTKSAGKGTGLGLPQVLGVVKQLGGGIRIDSRQGHGTRVSVYLPLAPATTPPVADVPVPHGAVTQQLQGLHVLLVDDEPEVRQAVAALLRDLGCRVLVADGAEKALRQLEHGMPLHVAVLDYAMPGMNGVELAARLRRRLPDLPVLLMSGYLSSESLPAGWSAPVLKKPFTPEALARHLGNITRPALTPATTDRS